MPITVSVGIDERRLKKKTGKYPVKLLLIVEGKPFRYQTIYDLSTEENQLLSASRVSARLQKIRDDLKQIHRDAEVFVSQCKPFSIECFERDVVKDNPLFVQRKRKNKSKGEYGKESDHFDLTPFKKKFKILKEVSDKEDALSTVFIKYVVKLLKEDRIGSALNYQDSYNSLKKFNGNVRLPEITVDYLFKYERWMRKRKRSKSTVGIKLRPLRAIFNYAIDALGIIRRETCYPFGRYKYLIPASKNTKKALDMDILAQLYFFEARCKEEQMARDYWFFQYFGNGMNPKDMALLIYGNIDGEYLVFERAKTINTSRTDPKPIRAYITSEMWEIMDRWGNKDKHPDNYIFPVLDASMTALEQHYAVKAFVKFILQWNEKIRQELKIEKKVGSMQARHTCATRLKRSGASTEFIQETLGHADKQTTENYLDSFEDDIKKDFAAELSAFKRQNKSGKQIRA